MLKIWLGNTCDNVVNVTLAQGESVTLSVQINVGSTPLSLSGYSFKMTIGFTSPLVFSTSNGGVTIIDSVNGLAQINITDTASAAFTPGSYAYDFWSISPSGQAIQLFNGTFTVLKSISVIP